MSRFPRSVSSEANFARKWSASGTGTIREHPYRFLVCADKFQTGYDEPLLHTIYVDKTLSGIRAVQTLARLNRAHPKKHDVFVLDFLNDAGTIRDAFADYYRTQILSDETDPDKLHDVQADLDGAQVYTSEQVESFVRCYLADAGRGRLDPVLDECVAVYLRALDEDGQAGFKGKAKAFVRAYSFLSCVLPYTNAGWEIRSIFLNFLIPRLPSPCEDDLSRGILDAIDMDSYRIKKQAVQETALPDEDAAIDPPPPSGASHRPDPDMGRLSNIVGQFNDRFGGIQWEDKDRVEQLITRTISERAAANEAYRNARKNSDAENTGIEFDRAPQLDFVQNYLTSMSRRSRFWRFRRGPVRAGARGPPCLRRPARTGARTSSAPSSCPLSLSAGALRSVPAGP